MLTSELNIYYLLLKKGKYTFMWPNQILHIELIIRACAKKNLKYKLLYIKRENT